MNKEQKLQNNACTWSRILITRSRDYSMNKPKRWGCTYRLSNEALIESNKTDGGGELQNRKAEAGPDELMPALAENTARSLALLAVHAYIQMYGYLRRPQRT